MIVVQVLLLGAAILLALFYFGFGATRLFLPPPFAPYRFLLTAFTGMALVVVWDYLALFIGLNLTYATWGLLGITTLLNLGVLAREFSARKRIEAGPRAQWIVLLLALAIFFATVAPLFRYGYLTIIGENWDYENSMPLADYLRRFTMQTLAQAPANPLLKDLMGRHIAPLPWAFSYLLATFNTFLNRDALDLFAILLGVLRGLSVIAAFVFCRVALKMQTRPSLLATGLYSVNGLLLWFTYWNFGPHDTALALLPVALTAGIVALRTGDARAILFAALLLAALNIAFNPAFTLALLILGTILACFVIFPEDQDLAGAARRRALLAGLGLIGLTLVLSFPTLVHAGDLYREYYATTGRTPAGVREFVPLSDGYGLSLYTLERVVGHTIPTPSLFDAARRLWDALSLPLLLFVMAISGWGVVQIARNRSDTFLTRAERATWFAIVGVSMLYLALLRLPFLRPYPYGFLKALSLVNLPLLALFAQGFFLLPAQPRWVAWAGRAGMALVIALALITFALSFEQYFKPAPAFFDADALRVRELKTIVPRGASVFLTDRAQAQKIPMGLAAYALREYELRGDVTTGYGKLENAEAGKVYDYALLARGEAPATRGYENSALWKNETFALYARAPQVKYQRALDAATVAPNPLQLTIGATQIVSDTKILNEPVEVRDARLSFATFVPQRVTVSYESTNQALDLTPGLSTLILSKLETPTTVTIAPQVAQAVLDSAVVTLPHDLPDAEVRLWLPYAQLRAPQNENPLRVLSAPDAILVTCTSGSASELNARCFVANPGKTELTWRWIVRGTLKGTREERVITQGDAHASPQSQIDFSATVSRGLARMQFDNVDAVEFEPQGIPDGNYRGDLEVYTRDTLLARVELYRFEVKQNGQSMTRVSPHDGELVILQP